VSRRDWGPPTGSYDWRRLAPWAPHAHIVDSGEDRQSVGDASSRELHGAWRVEEEEANVFAATTLIHRRYDGALAELQTDADVHRFADDLGIAPGIVVGRLQKEEIWPWSRGNRLKRKLRFADED